MKSRPYFLIKFVTSKHSGYFSGCFVNLSTVPTALVKAHRELDRVVDLAYRPQPFTSETKRIEFLFDLYNKYTAGLFQKTKKKKRLL